jgi:hypothetical protein
MAPPSRLRVFISSAEDEFADLRLSLRDALNSEYAFNMKRTDDKAELVHQGLIAEGFLVERESDESFDTAMKRGIESSQIYVGIFGNQYSRTTVKEYHAARRRGLPLLIYYFAKPPRAAIRTRTKVVDLLETEVKSIVKIRGNYRRVAVRDDSELIDLILSDVVARLTDLARESVAARKAMLESAPPEFLAAVLRAKKSVFD